MHDLDNLLEQSLQALEDGQPIETVLKQLPTEAGELADLLRLAASMKAIPHPEPQRFQALQSELVAATRQPTIPAHRSAPAPRRQPFLGGFKLPRFALPALAAALGIFLLVFGAVAGNQWIGGNLWFVNPAEARAATLIDVSGKVEAASAQGNTGKTTVWQIVADGGQVQSGQRLRTAAASSATLVFFDGSRTTLGPSSEILLESLNGRQGKVLQARLVQLSGETSHSVVPFKSNEAFFTVQTPSGSASVHGTTFQVSVDDSGAARFSVDSGEVRVSSTGSEVSLLPGQVTIARQGQAPEAPAYGFHLQGELSAGKDLGWLVSGVPLQMSANAQAAGLKAGAQVLVAGRIRQDGAWVVDQIEPASVSTAALAAQSSFTGLLKGMQGDRWQVGDQDVLVSGETQLEKDLAPGKTVRVAFAPGQGKGLAATSITTLEDTPLPTADPNAKPSLSFQPDEVETSTCGKTSNDLVFTYTGTLVNTGEEAKDVAADVVIGYSGLKNASLIDHITLEPNHWDTIAAGQSVSFTVQITLKPDWSTSLSDTEVKVRIFIAHELNRPDHLKSRLTVTVSSDCHLTATPSSTFTVTPTSTITPTGNITPTTTATPTVTPTPVITDTTGITDCTGANPHPEAVKLAAKWGVTDTEIMGWFCQHFGFGEIDLAYGLSRQWGLPVENVFDLRRMGLGWGEIKKDLAATGTPNSSMPEKHRPDHKP